MDEVYLGWMDGDINGLTSDVTLPSLPKDLWTSLLLQMLPALDYLATWEVVHEDVNPANILIKRFPNGHVNFRLADFSNSGRLWTRYGDDFRPLFCAPEWTHFAEEKAGGTQPPADVWALAMTMICVSRRPHGTTMPEVWDMVDKGLFSEAVQAAFQHAAREVAPFESQKLTLLRYMICLNPLARATAREMSVRVQQIVNIAALRRGVVAAAAAKAAGLNS